jgi:hypothetical protein
VKFLGDVFVLVGLRVLVLRLLMGQYREAPEDSKMSDQRLPKETYHLYLKFSDPYSHTPSHFFLVRELEKIEPDGKGVWGYETEHGDYELINRQKILLRYWPIGQKTTGEGILKETIAQKEQEEYTRAEVSNVPHEWRRRMGLWIEP